MKSASTTSEQRIVGPTGSPSVERRAWFALGAFALVWILEIYLMQRTTLIYSSETGELFRFTSPIIRFALDALFVIGLTLLLPRWSLVIVSLIVFATELGLMTYFAFFHRPMSFLTVMHSWSNAGKMSGITWDLIPNAPLMALGAVLVLKMALLWLAGVIPYWVRGRWIAGAGMFAGYATLLFLISYRDPLSAIKTTRGVGRLGAMRGYLEPWAAEFYYLTNGELLNDALDARKRPSDNLTPIEVDIPLRRRLVIIQAESLDNHCLGYQVNGREVTPFLNELKRRSMFYRVAAFHSLGSSDADFVMLTGYRPVNRTNTYMVLGYPYEGSLPGMLKPLGFKTTGIHGMSGSFYERRQAFEQMGFDRICFEEDMNNKYGLQSPLWRTRWGGRDEEVFGLSRRLMKEDIQADKICHFIITLTTHAPFNMLEPQPDDLFPHTKKPRELYLNNMHYLDRCLRDYVGTLRDATVIIYGDHSVGDSVPGFTADQVDKGDGEFTEYVPCFIFDTEDELSQRQKSGAAATDGSLNFLDFATYLRRQIERANRASPLAPPEEEKPMARAN